MGMVGSRAGHKTARATNAVTVDRITVETVATVASGGTSGDRIKGGRIRVAGISGHGISAASTTPVGTISPSTGRVNVLSRTGTRTAVPGASGSWACGSRCDLSGERSRVRADAALAIGGAGGDMPLAPLSRHVASYKR